MGTCARWRSTRSGSTGTGSRPWTSFSLQMEHGWELSHEPQRQHRAAGAARIGPPLPGRTGPANESPRADGDRGRDRPRRLAAGQRSAGPAGDRRNQGWRLDGHKSFVLDGHAADLILVVAATETDGQLSLFAVTSTADGLTRQALP